MAFRKMSVNNDRDPLLPKIRPSRNAWSNLMVLIGVLAVAGAALTITFGVLYGNANDKLNARQAFNFPKSGNLKLFWSDEFSGSSIDSAKWTHHDLTGAGSGNNERQIYVRDPENSFVEGGNLHIKVTETPPTLIPESGLTYIARSAKVLSKEHFMYGYTEIRASLPVRNYMVPAIWMFPVTSKTNSDQPQLPVSKYFNWPRTGEIDIVELFGTFDTTRNFATQDKAMSNAIGAGPDFWFGSYVFSDQLKQYPGTTVVNNRIDYHTYGVEWTPDVLRFYIDASVVNGKIVGGTVSHEIPREQWVSFNAMGDSTPDGQPFDQPMPLIMLVAVMQATGGLNVDFPQEPANTIPDFTDAEMHVDYVRYYKFDGEENIVQVPKAISSDSQAIVGGHYVPPAKKNIVRPRSGQMSPNDFIHRITAMTIDKFASLTVRSTTALMNASHTIASEAQTMAAGIIPFSHESAKKNIAPKNHFVPYTLEWEENFSGNNLDITRWRRRELSPAPLDFLCAASSTTDIKNAYLENDKLIIQPRKEEITHPFVTPTTTVAVASNGASFPVNEIFVESTEEFADAGQILIDTTAGTQWMYYESKTPNSFIIINTRDATGTLSTGNSVRQPEYQRFFPFDFPRRIANISTAQIESLNPIVGYGYFEIRAKVPVQDSAFAKIELVRLTKDAKQDTALPYGQIMVTAQSGLTAPSDSLIGIQYGGPFDAEARSLITDYFTAPVADRSGWHTYGVEILPGLIRWYLDATVENGVVTGGTLLGERTSDAYYTVNVDGSISTVPNSPFDKKLFLRMSVIPGGGGSGFSGENSYHAWEFPAAGSYPFSALPASKMEIEFIRFHKY